jgi:hypothetical protein
LRGERGLAGETRGGAVEPRAAQEPREPVFEPPEVVDGLGAEGIAVKDDHVARGVSGRVEEEVARRLRNLLAGPEDARDAFLSAERLLETDKGDAFVRDARLLHEENRGREHPGRETLRGRFSCSALLRVRGKPADQPEAELRAS